MCRLHCAVHCCIGHAAGEHLRYDRLVSWVQWVPGICRDCGSVGRGQKSRPLDPSRVSVSVTPFVSLAWQQLLRFALHCRLGAH